MKLSLANILMLAGLLSVSQAFGQDAKVQKELKKFEGTWKLESFKMGGKELPATELDKISVKFKGNEIHVSLPDGKGVKGEFKLDLNSTPALLDYTGNAFGKRGTFKCIYKFDQGKLIICANLIPNAKQRPAKFESQEGSMTVLEVLRRSEE